MRAFLAVLIVFASVSAEAHKKRTVRKVMLSARTTSTGIAFDVAVWGSWPAPHTVCLCIVSDPMWLVGVHEHDMKYMYTHRGSSGQQASS